jgi:hypothetical protein
MRLQGRRPSPSIPLRDQLRRDRASAQTLRSTFPLLGHIRIDMTFEEPQGISPAPQTHVLHPGARAFFTFPCPYSHCEGKFDLTRFARDSAERADSQVAGTLECSGTRPRSGATRQPCGLILNYEIASGLLPPAIAHRR